VQRLKSLRSKLARQRGVPAYVVFSDRTLIDMAAKKPLSKWDFGEVFMAKVRAFVQVSTA
jgi:ATP-dependent DNA helicase RecQ